VVQEAYDAGVLTRAGDARSFERWLEEVLPVVVQARWQRQTIG
jgi:hypothetical protein